MCRQCRGLTSCGADCAQRASRRHPYPHPHSSPSPHPHPPQSQRLRPPCLCCPLCGLTSRCRPRRWRHCWRPVGHGRLSRCHPQHLQLSTTNRWTGLKPVHLCSAWRRCSALARRPPPRAPPLTARLRSRRQLPAPRKRCSRWTQTPPKSGWC